MSSRAFLFLGLLFAIFILASEVSASDLAETEQRDEINGLEESKYVGGCGRYGCGVRGRCCCGGGGGVGGGGRCCRYGCCVAAGFRCRCCESAAEAEAYAAAQAKAKPQN